MYLTVHVVCACSLCWLDLLSSFFFHFIVYHSGAFVLVLKHCVIYMCMYVLILVLTIILFLKYWAASNLTRSLFLIQKKLEHYHYSTIIDNVGVSERSEFTACIINLMKTTLIRTKTYLNPMKTTLIITKNYLNPMKTTLIKTKN